MDAITLLQQHINAERLLEHYEFDKVRQDGDMLRACCKIHGGNNPTAFVINADTGLWYCHTGCGGGGDAFKLVQQLEGCSLPRAVEIVAELMGVDITNMTIAERKQEHIEELKKFVNAMRSRKRHAPVEYRIPADVREVTKFRGFAEETLKHFNLGWVAEVQVHNREGNAFTVKNRLVFPIYQNGVMVGASYRRVQPNDTPKWSHQPPNIQTNQLLYNYDNVIGESEITIVEGLPDAWAYHEIGIPAVATFGAHLTEEQYKLLMRTGADLNLSYDGDDAGNVATQKARELFRNKAIVRQVVLDPGTDPENIPREELLKRYEERKKI